MKHTTGGTYDPQHPFIYFLATTAARHNDAADKLEELAENAHKIVRYPHVLVAVNELFTPHGKSELERLIDQGRKVLIDSGIFNLAMSHARAHGMHMDDALALHPTEIDGFDRLRDLYYEIATTYSDRIWGMIEMDQGGAAVKPETRAMIEKDTGIVPIPVLHPLLDGWDYYHALANEYDRICIGNLVKAAAPLRMALLHKAYVESRKHPNTWHHLLGVTPSELSPALPIKGSCDSSTWLNGVRWMQGWKAKASGKGISLYGPDMWYSRGSMSYHRVDAVSIRNSQVLEAFVQDERSIA